MPSMTQVPPPPAAAQPPFWLALLAGLPAIASLALMVIPDLGHGHAAVFKSLYLGLCLLWSVPLAALQRALWRRGLAWWRLLGIVFAATYAMAVANNLAGQLLAIAMGWKRDATVQWTSLLGGLESCWLALLAAGAAHAVLAYAYRLRREQAQHLAARAAMRDAELRALRYQLQPHFLFNTLNAVSALVAERRNAEAQAMIARLGDFLRGTLAAPQAHEVPLGEEIAAAEDYLDIERARLGDRLRLRWQVGPEVLRALSHLRKTPDRPATAASKSASATGSATSIRSGSTGSRPTATTPACTSARVRTCCANRCTGWRSASTRRSSCACTARRWCAWR